MTIKQTFINIALSEFRRIGRERDNFQPSYEYNGISSIKTIDEQKKLHYQRYDNIEKQFFQLLNFIVKTPDEQLPDALFLRFLDEKPPYKQSNIIPYIFSMDNDVIIPIINKQYEKLDIEKRNKILFILETIKPRKTLPLVKQALNDPDSSVRLQAQKTLISIWRLGKKAELKKMLIATKNSWRLKPTARDFSLIGNQEWYRKFFTLVKEKKVSLYDLSLLGSTKHIPEDIIGENLVFLINTITSNNPRNSFFHKDPVLVSKRTAHGSILDNVNITKQLLSRIHQPKYIQKLHTLLPTLLYDRYWGGESTGGSSTRNRSTQNKLYFNSFNSNQLLKKITSTLQAEDIKQWKSKIPSDFLTDLFLNDLLAQKTGTDLSLYDKYILLRITVINRNNNKILAESDYLLSNYKETNIILTSKSKNYPDQNITINIYLDCDKWMYLASVAIDFKPHGVAFDAYIPFAGINKMFFTTPDSMPEKKQRTVWIFEHIYQEN